MNRIKLIDKRIQNEKSWPQTYTRKFIEQGLVSYKENPKLNNLLLRKETIDKIIPSFIDKPVVIRHKEVDTDNFKDLAVGYIKNIYFNPTDGWYYVDFLITHDEGHDKINAGWGVSCAYHVSELGAGGVYHNIDYTKEILNGEGEHMALVENPRYEDCLMQVDKADAALYNEKSFLASTNKTEDNKMKFNIFGKKDEKGLKPETVIDLGNGKTAKVGDLIKAYNSKQESHEIAGDTVIEIANGKEVSIADLVKVYNETKTDEGEKKDEEKDEEKDEGDKKAENAVKMKNCGCNGKDDAKHDKECSMYNGKNGKEAMENSVDPKDKEIARLQNENAAYKEAMENGGPFLKIKNARQHGKEENEMLQNGTTHSGSMADKMERSRHFFRPAGAAK